MSEPPRDFETDGGDDQLAELTDEFLRRHRTGERPTIDEYTGRYPELAARIRDVFPALIVMEQPDPRATADPEPAAERIGATIGRYKLLERIGEGGFGVVYMAEQQEPVRRRVALKLIKPGMDSRQVLARFEAERQALAIMDHPNIARVFDAGATDSGRPYFVMELVKGEPITEFCDRSHFSPRQRLELFAQVCQAVQHAHQKGIIHRDIKPSNVLVMMHDTTPVVKVIDFGVAKALGQELTEMTLFTGFAQLVGTPLYMSPEQAGHSALDIDTRSDIYSLGVLLYELLTGTTPFDKERFKKAAQDEIRRIIREEEPPKPSTRLSESKDSLPSISAQRHMEPAKLTKLVRGELDWIVMKALEKDRSRRYETANGLASDVQRYLADEQVQACPPSGAYRLKKFVRRNKTTLVTAAVIGMAVLFGVGSMGWMMRDRSVRYARLAGQVELLLGEVDGLQRQQKWAEALSAARRAEAAVTGGEADATTQQRVDSLLKDLKFIEQLEKIRMLEVSLIDGDFDSAGTDRAYAQAFREYGADVEQLPVETSIAHFRTRPQLGIPVAAALDNWVRVRRLLSNTDSGRWTRLVTIARGIDPEPLRDRLRASFGRNLSEVRDELRELAKSLDVAAQNPATLTVLGLTLKRVGESDAELRLMREAQRIYPGDFWINFELGRVLRERNDVESIRFKTAAVAIRPNSSSAHNHLGIAMVDAKRFEEAEACFKKAIELDPNTSVFHYHLGIARREQKDFEGALARFRRAIELDPKYALPYAAMGAILCDQKKRYEEAAGLHRKAIELDPKCAAAYCGLGAALGAQQKYDEAIIASRKAIELNPKIVEAHENLGTALDLQNKLDEAIVVYRKAIDLDPKNMVAYTNLGGALLKQKKLDEAIAVLQKAVEINPRDAAAYNNLGAALGDQKRPQEAIAALRKAVALDGSRTATMNLATGLGRLGEALRSQGRPDDALAANREAAQTDPKNVRLRNRLNWAINDRAWKLASDPNSSARDPKRAVELAREAVALEPKNSDYWNTLGVALYRAGEFSEAASALEKSRSFRSGNAEWANPFFLAMAHHRLGNKDKARHWYDKGSRWMDETKSKSEALIRFRNEAAELLGVTETKHNRPTTSAATTNVQPVKN